MKIDSFPPGPSCGHFHGLAAAGRIRGYTLYTLLGLLVLAGLGLAWALPHWFEREARGRRADALDGLDGLALRSERWFAAHGRYPADLRELGASDYSPKGLYRLSLEAPRRGAADQASYLLIAVPVGPQAGDLCGIYRYDEMGAEHHQREEKVPGADIARALAALGLKLGNESGELADRCWDRES